ncbi:MAG: hypothetical protein IPM06_19975 [Rhizobiales bacterium]|nr:hypothetical protein [Hyphomicrobiales bacterium]
MNDLIQPAQIPAEILKDKRGFSLYFVAVVALAAIGVLAVLGGLLLAWADRTVPGEIWTFAGLAVGGLVALVGSDKGGA